MEKPCIEEFRPTTKLSARLGGEFRFTTKPSSSKLYLAAEWKILRYGTVPHGKPEPSGCHPQLLEHSAIHSTMLHLNPKNHV